MTGPATTPPAAHGGRDGHGLAETLLALAPGRFAREAQALADSLPDHERGLLASALVSAYEQEEGSFGGYVAALGLDSADPGLMSSTDLGRVLSHTQRERPGTFRRALRTLHDQPRMIHLLGAPFAPLPESSDTSHIARLER